MEFILSILAGLLYMVVTGFLAIFCYYMHERAERKGTAYRGRYSSMSIWSLIAYVSAIAFCCGFLGVCSR